MPDISPLPARRPALAGAPLDGDTVITRALHEASLAAGGQAAILTRAVGAQQTVCCAAGGVPGLDLRVGAGVRLAGSPPGTSTVPPDASDPSVLRAATVAGALPLDGEGPAGAYVGVPVRLSDGSRFGLLCLLSGTPRNGVDERDVHLLRAVATLVTAEIERRGTGGVGHRFRQVLDCTDEGVWVTTLDGRTLYVNQATADLVGVPVEELYQRDSAEVVRACLESGEWSAAEMMHRRSEGNSDRYPLRLRLPDGSPAWVQVSGSPLLDETGAVIGTVAVIADISKIKDAEGRLLQAQELARLGSFEYDRDADIATGSERTLRMFGLGQLEQEGSLAEMLRFVLPENRERMIAVGRAFDSDGSDGLVISVQVPNEPLRHVAVRFEQLAGVQGGRGRLLGTVQDVTEQQAAADAIRAREAAERSSEAKSLFLSRMSHELRTPLNAVLGFGQLLQLDPLTTEQQESVALILRAGGHLLDLINEVLEISRIESGTMHVELTSVDLHDVVARALALLAPAADAQGVRLIGPEPADEPVQGLADRQRVEQIVLNLVGNAIKYNRHDGTVEVRISSTSTGDAQICVCDEGHGMTEQQAERAFSPFERLDAAERGIEGTGLGLSLSRNLAEAMRGTLEVESEPGAGSTFTLTLTGVGADARCDASLAVTRAPADVPAAPLLGRVLVAEDNVSNLRLVERILAPHTGVHMTTAVDGATALRLAAQSPPDVVLLDLNLPDMDGAEVLAALRRRPETQDLPVIVLSADATSEQTERLLAAGAHSYLTKPLQVDHLVSVLASALATPHG